MKNTVSKKNQQGFTLIELSIYLGLFMILVVVITDILVATLNIKLKSSSNSNISQDGRYIYSRFIYDLNRSDSIIMPANLGDITSTLQLTANSTTITYALDNGDLILSDQDGSHQLNGFDTSVSNLQFQRIGYPQGKPTIRINFTVNGKTLINGQTESINYQTTAGQR